MTTHATRRQLPDGLSPGERNFYLELRRVVDTAGLSYRTLEKKTSTVRTDAADPVFYSKSQWARWLNGRAMPPRRAVRRLAAVLDDEDLSGERLLELWEQAAVPPRRDGHGKRGERSRQSDSKLADQRLPPRQAPAVTPHFTGRAAELTALGGLADRIAGGGTEVVVIVGTAGVGKTTLANYFCTQSAARFPDGQLHVNLRGFDPGGRPLDASAALCGFLEGLGVKPASVPTSVEAQAALYRTLVAGRSLLIVLDNARTVEQVRPLIPGSPGCLVVVTSRNELTGLIAQGAHVLTLAPFSTDDALGFLTRRLGAERVEGEPRAAADLVGLCAALPLALGVAAAHAAARPALALSALAEELRDRGLDQLDTGDPETSARTVFSWSYDDLPEQAKRMFRLLGVHPGPDTGVNGAASLTGLAAADADAALGELSRAHLADEHAAGRFAMHDLLRAYAAELATAIDGPDSLRVAEVRVLDHYLHTGHAAALLLAQAMDFGGLTPAGAGVLVDPPGSVEEAITWFAAESRPLLAACARAAERDLAAYCWQLPWVVAPYLIGQGRWVDAAETQRVAVAAAERAGDLRGLGHAHYHLAHALDLTGDRESVEPHLRRALDAFTRTRDPLGRGLVLYGLARLLQERGRDEEALPAARESLLLRTEHGTPSMVATSQNTLGAICARLGMYTEAVEHCRRALRVCEEAGLPMYRGEALYYLGLAYFWSGDHAAAAGHFAQASVALREMGDLPDLASVLTLLANAREAVGDTDAARFARAEADAILGGMPPPDAARVRAWISREAGRAPAPVTDSNRAGGD